MADTTKKKMSDSEIKTLKEKLADADISLEKNQNDWLVLKTTAQELSEVADKLQKVVAKDGAAQEDKDKLASCVARLEQINPSS